MAKDNWVSRVASSARNLFTQPHYIPGQIGNKPIVNLSKPTQQLANLMQVSTAESDRPLYPTWDARSALRDGFNASHYVYSCIMLLSKEAARPIWMLEQRATGKGKERFWEPIPDSDFEALMLHPNAHQSGLDLMERGLQHFFLTGNMLFLKVRSAMRSRVPKELYNIQPDQIRPVPSRNNFLSHYEFTSPGMEPIAIDPDDIIHIQIANPATPFWGMSPLQAMSRIVDTEVDALNWWRWAIRNRAAKDGFIKYKRMLTDDEYTKIKRQLIEQVVGPWNARLPMILTGDADWVATSSDAVDMDFIDLRKMTREEICFVPGTQIVTSEGLRPIEEVEVGDLVLTHTGKFQRVLETMANPYEGEVVTLKAKSLEATTCTPNHPWYVVMEKCTREHQRVSTSPVWAEAGELTPRSRNASGRFDRQRFDNLTLPVVASCVERFDLLETSSARVVEVNGQLRFPNPRAISVPRWVGLTPGLGYLIGTFLGDGTTSDHQTRWYFGPQERAFAEEVKNTLHSVFGVSSTISQLGVTVNVTLSNKILTQFFASFGKRASSKFIPAWVLQGPERFRAAVLAGYTDADGCYHRGERTSATTRSLSLAWGIRLLGVSLGVGISVRETDGGVTTFPDGCTYPSTKRYDLQWGAKLERQGSVALATSTEAVRFHLESKTTSQYTGLVFNLRVEEDNSYVTTGGTCHNCGGFGIPPMLVGIMDQATYNNLREARMGLWQDTIVTYLDKFRSAFDHQLLPDFISGPALRKHRTAPDLSRIPALLNHLSSMAEPAGKFWQMGVPFNELNARFGLGFRPLPPEVGDISWVGSLTQPAEEALNDGAEGQPAFSTDWSDIQSIAEGKPPKSPPQRGKPMAGSPNPSANVPQGKPTPRRVKPP